MSCLAWGLCEFPPIIPSPYYMHASNPVVCLLNLFSSTIMSILRLHSLIVAAKSFNLTWDFLELALWSSVELTAAIVCACLPSFRLMLVKLFKAFYESKPPMRTYNGHYGVNDPTCAGFRGHPPHVLAGNWDGDGRATSGITRGNYMVQDSENDEIILIGMKSSMKSLDPIWSRA